MTNLHIDDQYRPSYNVVPNSNVQCVLVGDAGVGKTSLIVSYTTNGYPGKYIPTAYDKYSVTVQVDEHLISLELCDTAGMDEFDSLRKLSYSNADVFLLCFSVASRRSFSRLQQIWLFELKQKNLSFCSKPTIVVGTQCDLRTNLETIIKLEHIHNKGRMDAMVSEREAQQFSEKIGASAYIECSALTQRNLKKVFDTAILAGLLGPNYVHNFVNDNKFHDKHSSTVDYRRSKVLLHNICRNDWSRRRQLNYRYNNLNDAKCFYYNSNNTNCDYRTEKVEERVAETNRPPYQCNMNSGHPVAVEPKSVVKDNSLKSKWKKFVKLFS